MGEVINLKQYRKRKAREEAAAVGAENRARHGRAKADKKAEKAERERAARELEAKRREDEPKS